MSSAAKSARAKSPRRTSAKTPGSKAKGATAASAKRAAAKAKPAKNETGPAGLPAAALLNTAPRRVGPAVISLGALNDRLGYFIRRVQVWIFQDFIRRLSSIDISPAQFSVLVVIGANEGLSQSQLAATLGIERARLVRLLHRLEQRGLTQRLPSSADGRRHALRLTRNGQAELKRAEALAARHEEVLKAKLGAARYETLLDAVRDL